MTPPLPRPEPPSETTPPLPRSGRLKAQLSFCILALAALLGAPRPAAAHEFRPGLLDITTSGDGRYEITWDPPPGASKIQPVFSPRCVPAPLSAAGARRFSLDCAAPGLEGTTLAVTGLAPLRDEVLVRLHLGGGVELTAMLSAARPSLAIPAAAAPSEALTTITSYAVAGAEHLLTGPDHVLFVLGLLLLVRHRRTLLGAVTAFTLAHSLTLALQVLGAVQLPPAPVEAAIALSVLFLARELLRPPAQPTLLRRRPWLAAFAFGLLHGLGFAAGLASYQLPRGHLAAALFGFNLGLEAAQLALIFAALALARALRPLASRLARARPPSSPAQRHWTRAAPAYGLGAAATFWLFQRIAAFWS